MYRVLKTLVKIDSLVQRSNPQAVSVFVLGFEVGLDLEQGGEQLLGQMQEKVAERWSDMGVEEEFWSVKVSVLLLDAGYSCVSGLSSGCVLRG